MADTDTLTDVRADPEVTAGSPTLTKTTPPPAPPSPFQKGIAALEKVQAEEEGQIAARNKDMAGVRADYLKASGQYAREGHAALADLQAKQKDIQPFKPGQSAPDAWNWMMLAAAFGSLAGAFSRYHVTTALNAFAGMNTGWAQGNMQVYQQKYTEWKAATEAARENNAKALEQYHEIMADKKLNLDQKAQYIQMVAAQYQDELAFSAAKEKNITQLTDLFMKQEALQAKMDVDAAKITQGNQKLMLEALKLKNANLNTPQGIETLASQLEQEYKSGPEGAAHAKFTLSILYLMHPGGNVAQPPDLESAFADPKAAAQPGFFSTMIYKMLGQEPPAPGAAPAAGAPAAAPAAGAPAAAAPAAPGVAPPAPAAPAPPEMVQPPPGSEGQPLPLPPALSAVRGVVRDLSNAGNRTPTPGDRRFIAENARLGRDGSTRDKAIILSKAPGVGTQQASMLPPGTWVVNPANGQAIQIGSGAMTLARAQAARRAGNRAIADTAGQVPDINLTPAPSGARQEPIPDIGRLLQPSELEN